MSNTNNNSEERILEVTQEEYDAAMRRGWNNDDIHKPGKYVYRRAKKFATAEDLHPSNTTVHVTLPIQLDVLKHFEQKAARLQLESFEKLINNELRRIMERDQQEQIAEQEQKNVAELRRQLLADPEFVRELKEKLAA